MEKHHAALTIMFIATSTAVFTIIGKPVKVLVFVGTLNGFVLPIALAILLIASGKSRLMGTYKHSRALLVMGWLVVAAMTALAIGIY